MNSFRNFAQTDTMIKVGLACLVIFILVTFYRKTQEKLENTDNLPAFLQGVSTRTADPAPPAAEATKVVQASGSNRLSPAELLPAYDEANTFAKENPVTKLLQEQNFVTSGYHAGINTVVQSNKIPYLDLRSAPAIPKQSLGPFMNSSYEEPAGAKRRHFEIGE